MFSYGFTENQPYWFNTNGVVKELRKDLAAIKKNIQKDIKAIKNVKNPKQLFERLTGMKQVRKYN